MWMLFDTAGVGGWEGFSLHGFTLRALPAVTHGAYLPGTVGACMYTLFSHPFLHGFTLRVSPAVTHGAFLPSAVGKQTILQWGVDTIRAWADAIRM